MNNYEFFESNESSLNSAYNSLSLNDELHLPYCDEEIVLPTPTESVKEEPIIKSTMSNLWDFLGLSTISEKKQGCLFDCSIHGARCLEKCKYKNPQKCKYRCLKNGLNCSKKCVLNNKCMKRNNHSNNNANNHANNHSNNHANNANNHSNNANNHSNNNANNHANNHSNNHSNSKNHSNNANNHSNNANNHSNNANNHSNNANNHANNANNHSNNANNHSNNANNNSNNAKNDGSYIMYAPTGNKHDFSDYAPYNSSLWPSHTQSGWDLQKINNLNKEDYIEVLVPDRHVFPEESPTPGLLF